MKKSVKSQVTMLIIIGLLLFIAVSLVLYLSKYAIKKQSEKAIKSSLSSGSQSIKEFVNQCVDKLSKDAFVLLGKQAGYIYTSQGGTLIDFNDEYEGSFFAKYNDGSIEYSVSYSILPPKFDVSGSIYFANPPDYPWRLFPYLTDTPTIPTFIGFFGLNGVPPLEKTQGAQSIQRQVEFYVDSNMPACLDFSSFEAEGFEIQKEASKTSVVIGSKDVSVNSKIPITIKNPKTEETTELNDFSANIGLRFKDIYLLARNLVQNDITNIKFDIKSLNGQNSFDIEVKPSSVEGDDLIIIKDKKSLIYGNKPFEYVFARINRAPALHRLNENVAADSGSVIDESKLLNLLGVGNFEAEDSDEDKGSLTFTVTPSSYTLTSSTDFTVKVSDGKLEDYQVIEVNII